jgi:hypothetical protein
MVMISISSDRHRISVDRKDPEIYAKGCSLGDAKEEWCILACFMRQPS